MIRTDHTSQKISVFFDESGFRHDPSQLAVFRKAKAHIEYSGMYVYRKSVYPTDRADS